MMPRRLATQPTESSTPRDVQTTAAFPRVCHSLCGALRRQNHRLRVKPVSGRRVAVIRFIAEPESRSRYAWHVVHLCQSGRMNLKSEVGDKPFDQVKSEAAATWERRWPSAHKRRIGDPAQSFLLVPLPHAAVSRIWHERDAGRQHRTHERLQQQGGTGIHVRDHGYWTCIARGTR